MVNDSQQLQQAADYLPDLFEKCADLGMNDHDQLYVPSRVIYQKKGQERAVLAVQNAVEQARAFYGKCPQLVIWCVQN